MESTPLIMPDGTPFAFWDDTTRYTETYHVACVDPHASDENPGTADRPFATIGRAAAILRPGEKVVVHRGTYRECVRPARGGAGADRMIAYEAAPGEEVRVSGSMPWKPHARPSEGWRIGEPEGAARVLMADLPAEWFIGYNPFIANNMSAEFTTFTSDWSNDEKQRMQLRRGMIFCNGKLLRQVFRITELAKQDDAFWVEDPGLRIHFRLSKDVDPAGAAFEVTAREQCFAPAERGLGWIRVSGFIFDNAADGVPVPQRAMVGTCRGHHWIIEDCTISWANSTGLDVGNGSWHAPEKPTGTPRGNHIIRRNHVSDCGVCGMAGVTCVDGTLVEDNTVERIGAMNIERIWETGGLKFHVCKGVLIRRNVFRHITHAPGVWLDYLNENCRITGNVFADISSLNGGIYLEVSQAPNLIDHNLFWNIRNDGGPERQWGGAGVCVDTGEKAIIVHNLFCNLHDNYAVRCHLGQAGRVVGGRTGLCRNQRVLNNVFVDCPRRILFSRREDNISDGNLFDARNDPTSFSIQFPAPEALQNLAGWQEHYSLDQHSTQARLGAQFDPENCELTLTVEGVVPAKADEGLPGQVVEPGRTTPGPFDLKQGRQLVRLR